MFRVSVFCEDKRLAVVLRSLTGLVVGPPEVTPVVNAEVEGGKMKAKTNGQSLNKFLHYMKENGVKEFSPAEGKKICQAIGLAPGSASYFFKRMIEEGALKRSGKTSKARYTLVTK